MREIGEVNIQAHTDLAHLVGNSAAVMTVGPEMYQHFIPELKASSYS